MKCFAYLCLPIALLSCLPSCTTRAVRPSKEPEPPVVRCEKGATPDPPDWPVLWWLDGPAFAITVLGILTEERQLRAEEHRCLADHRRAGHIR